MKMCIASFLQPRPCFFDIIGNKVLLYSSNRKTMQFSIVKNIDNNDIFWLKDIFDKDFILYHILGNLYQCIDCEKQCISGLPKKHLKIYEHIGCWIDKPTNSVCFRIAKNGSSQIAKAYSTDDNMFKKILMDKFIQLEDIDFASIEGMIKYFIWRDPMDRVLSQINHYMHIKNATCYQYEKIFSNYIFNSQNNTAKFILANYKVMHSLEDDILNIENDCHILQQCSILKKFIKANIQFTYLVDLKDLPNFMHNILNRENTNYSICGHNTSIKTISVKLSTEFNKLFYYDEILVKKYKNIKYIKI